MASSASGSRQAKASKELSRESSIKPDQRELHYFAGPVREVTAKLFSLPSDLVMRTFYVLLVQGRNSAEVRVFRRAGPDNREGSVEVWRGSSLGDLPSRVTLLINENSSEDLREAVISALNNYCDFQALGVVPCPISARGAFGHPLRLFAEETAVQAYVIAM